MLEDIYSDASAPDDKGVNTHLRPAFSSMAISNFLLSHWNRSSGLGSII